MNLNPDKIYEAISTGVERAMWQMITNNTDMPCADFYDTIQKAAKEAFEEVTIPAEAPPAEDHTYELLRLREGIEMAKVRLTSTPSDGVGNEAFMTDVANQLSKLLQPGWLDGLTGSAALSKACDDPFVYAMKLRTGEVLKFECAKMLNREWVHVTLHSVVNQPEENRIAYPADRGVDVRLSDIVWVMDAPEGS